MVEFAFDDVIDDFDDLVPYDLFHGLDLLTQDLVCPLLLSDN